MHFWFMYMVVLHILLFLFLSIFILFLRSALFYCFLCCKPFWVCVLNDLSSYHYFRKCCLQWQYVPYLGSRSQFPGMYPRWECSIFILKMSELFWKLFFLHQLPIIIWVSYCFMIFHVSDLYSPWLYFIHWWIQLANVFLCLCFIYFL